MKYETITEAVNYFKSFCHHCIDGYKTEIDYNDKYKLSKYAGELLYVNNIIANERENVLFYNEHLDKAELYIKINEVCRLSIEEFERRFHPDNH